MKRPPRSTAETLLSRRFLLLIGWEGVMLAAIALAAYLWALGRYGEGPHTRSVALLAVIGVQFGHTFNCRSRTRSAFDGFFRNPYIFAAAAMVILLQVAAFSIGPLAHLLDLVWPDAADVGVTLGCILLPIMIVEITKKIGR